MSESLQMSKEGTILVSVILIMRIMTTATKVFYSVQGFITQFKFYTGEIS